MNRVMMKGFVKYADNNFIIVTNYKKTMEVNIENRMMNFENFHNKRVKVIVETIDEE